MRRRGPRIAVAWDDAFAFYYADNLALLRAHGAELVFFSPLAAAELPVCDGLYLGGGYPELHAAGLSANERLRRDAAAAIAAGLPTYAECGGLLYLCDSLTDLDGRWWPLVGAVPGRATMHERLQGMGYREARLPRDSLLGPAGTIVRGHEFHYSSCELDDGRHAAYSVDGAPEGYAAGDLFASYVHLHFAGYPALLEHWLERCRTSCPRPFPRRSTLMSTALIVLGHGSRNAAATEQFHDLVAQLRDAPGRPVSCPPSWSSPSRPWPTPSARPSRSAPARSSCSRASSSTACTSAATSPRCWPGSPPSTRAVTFRFGRPIGPDARVAEILLERAGGGDMPGLKPHEIEVRSMEIIDGLLPAGDWSPGELAVVKRLVHTCGDPSLAADVRFSAGAVDGRRRGAARRGIGVHGHAHGAHRRERAARRGVRRHGRVPHLGRGDRGGVQEHRSHAGGLRHALVRCAPGRLPWSLSATRRRRCARCWRWPPRVWRGRRW